jgi:hypothetical protein
MNPIEFAVGIAEMRFLSRLKDGFALSAGYRLIAPGAN